MSDELRRGTVITPGGGSLFRYRHDDATATQLDSGFDISNGLDWNGSGDKLFFADTATEKIYIFDYDEKTSSTCEISSMFLLRIISYRQNRL